jgi:hypothetical protein
VTRNPKDVAVSFYFHLRVSPFPGIEWDDFWKKFVNGEVEFGNYFDHLLSWLPHKDDKNVLFLKYEDMKRDLPGAVSQIASFLEVDLSGDVIDKKANLTSFNKMKVDNSANYSWPPLHQEKGVEFMRKGTVGDWKNFFTAEQSAEMDCICTQKLNGIDFQYQ